MLRSGDFPRIILENANNRNICDIFDRICVEKRGGNISIIKDWVNCIIICKTRDIQCINIITERVNCYEK